MIIFCFVSLCEEEKITVNFIALKFLSGFLLTSWYLITLRSNIAQTCLAVKR